MDNLYSAKREAHQHNALSARLNRFSSEFDWCFCGAPDHLGPCFITESGRPIAVTQTGAAGMPQHYSEEEYYDNNSIL